LIYTPFYKTTVHIKKVAKYLLGGCCLVVTVASYNYCLWKRCTHAWLWIYSLELYIPEFKGLKSAPTGPLPLLSPTWMGFERK